MSLFDDASAAPARSGGATSSRAGRAAVALVTGAVVTSVATAASLAAYLPGLRFTAAVPAVATSAPPPPPKPVPSFTAATDSPAATVVATLLKPTPTGIPAGMQPASAVTGTVAPAVNLSCSRPAAPVVSQQRGWALPVGALGNGLTVTASAYSAGAGAAAFDAMRSAPSECRSGATAAARSGLGVEALDVVVTKGSATVRSVLLRRGDVVVSVSSAGTPIPAALLSDLDTRLDGLLAAPGVCADQSADATQFTRSLVSGPRFVGLQVPTQVALPAADRVNLPPLVTPSPTQPLPAPVVASTPAMPYWPPSAPAPVPSPTAPSAPPAYPTATAVPTPAPDQTGPGCGWAFTGMPTPLFDPAAAGRTAAEREAAAVAAMRAAVATYGQRVQAYAQAWNEYVRQATTYVQVNQQIGQVEAAWAVIRQQQADYAAALAAYQKQLAEYSTFGQRQQAAVDAYAAALAYCATASPAPEPTTIPAPEPNPMPTMPFPVPTVPVPVPWPTVPVPWPWPQDDQSPQASAGDTSSAAPAPFAAAAMPADPPTCPPVPDPIIHAQPPASPISPAPPADPRPTPAAGQ